VEDRFAIRSPRRPNLIALTPCKVLAVKDNVVEVEKMADYDTADDAKVPEWVRNR